MKNGFEIGFHASHEQFSPSELVALAVRAEQNGFDLIMSSDHLNPWSELQGQSGFTWSWLGAAMQATKHISFGTIAIPGGWRYHPVMVAQAAATLSEMFPNRLAWLALGSGEALNESVVSAHWPAKEERNERMLEGAAIIKALWEGNTVTKTGGHHFTCKARIWSLPEVTPKAIVAALSKRTAAFAAPWADGLITVNQKEEELPAIIKAFRDNGGAGKPVYVQLHISWNSDPELAMTEGFEQWRNNLLSGAATEDLRTVQEFEQAGALVTPEDFKQSVLFGSDFDPFLALIRKYKDLGFHGVVLHNIGKNQAEFIDAFGKHILPQLR